MNRCRVDRAIIVVSAGLALTACSHSTGSTTPTSTSSATSASAASRTGTPPTAATLWGSAQKELKALKSVHLDDEMNGGTSGKSATSALATHADMTLDGARATGTMRMGTSGTIDIRVADATRYVKYPRTMVVTMMTMDGSTTRAKAEKTADRIDGRWVKLPKSPTTQLVSQSLESLMGDDDPSAATDLTAPDATVTPTTMGGTPCWLISAPTGVKAWIASDGTNHLLRYVNASTKPMVETLTLSRFDEPVTVAAPSDAVDASTLPGFSIDLPSA